MKRRSPSLRIARYLEVTARRLRRGLIGDVRIIACQLDRAAAALRKVG